MCVIQYYQVECDKEGCDTVFTDYSEPYFDLCHVARSRDDKVECRQRNCTVGTKKKKGTYKLTCEACHDKEVDEMHENFIFGAPNYTWGVGHYTW